MARQETIVTIFVASPSDVVDERNKLEEVIKEQNDVWAKSLGIRLDLVRWETHAYPGIGDDAQDVINTQISDDWDIFIGIMWSRFGTPTGRYGSGTVEEFQRAKDRYDIENSNVKLMLYFKDEPLPPSKIDTNQLKMVNEFRSSLGDQGVLYWMFTDIDKFEQLIRIHLARQIQRWDGIKTARPGISESSPRYADNQFTGDIAEDDDEGFLDLLEIIESRFEDVVRIMGSIGSAIEELGEKIKGRTEQINRLVRDPSGVVNRQDAKRILAFVAADMNLYTKRINAETPLFNDALSAGMEATIRTIPMMADFSANERDLAQIKDALETMVSLKNSLRVAINVMVDFFETVNSLPRLTSDLNRAKRRLGKAISQVISEFENGVRLTNEVEDTMTLFLRDRDQSRLK